MNTPSPSGDEPSPNPLVDSTWDEDGAWADTLVSCRNGLLGLSLCGSKAQLQEALRSTLYSQRVKPGEQDEDGEYQVVFGTKVDVRTDRDASPGEDSMSGFAAGSDDVFFDNVPLPHVNGGSVQHSFVPGDETVHRSFVRSGADPRMIKFQADTVLRVEGWLTCPSHGKGKEPMTQDEDGAEVMGEFDDATVEGIMREIQALGEPDGQESLGAEVTEDGERWDRVDRYHWLMEPRTLKITSEGETAQAGEGDGGASASAPASASSAAVPAAEEVSVGLTIISTQRQRLSDTAVEDGIERHSASELVSSPGMLLKRNIAGVEEIGGDGEDGEDGENGEESNVASKRRSLG